MTAVDLSRLEQIRATGELPSPKGVALAILQMSQKEDVSIPELARVIRSDPAFVGRLLKAANGANAYGRRPAVSIHDALVILGLPAVRGLALGFSLVSEYGSGRCSEFGYSDFWSGSLVVAIAMQALAARTRVAMPEEAFSVGLLARVGELALATLYPDRYATVIAEARSSQDADLCALESDAFAVTHNELSAAMLIEWGLPKLYSDPVFFHEAPDQGRFSDGSRQAVLVRSLALARHLATICLTEPARRSTQMPRLFRLGSYLSIDSEILTALCDQVIKDWHDWGEFLGVRTNPVPPFEALARPSPDLSRPRADTSEIAPLSRIRVLVVDDDPTQRLMLRTVLEALGNDVVEAEDGEAGLRLALDVQPQMMIVDWVMPGMDGIELTRALRAAKIGRGIFVLLLTSFEDEDRLVEAYEAGVDDFMPKPFKPRVLAARLRAGQRVIHLQQEIERDREEIRHFAAELAVTNRRLQEAALTDSLTGCPNRRYAMERMHQEWAASLRSQRPLACMMIDIDHFKQINDGFGHATGDLMLRQTSAALKSALRVQDVICRMGGDEFLVICPDTALDAAIACANRVRKSVEAVVLELGLAKLSVGLSIGVAQRHPDMSDEDALIKAADNGTYLAKQRGRNQVVAVRPGGARSGA
jgi:diguanylate cyclase (GGDEF)-like protein